MTKVPSTVSEPALTSSSGSVNFLTPNWSASLDRGRAHCACATLARVRWPSESRSFWVTLVRNWYSRSFDGSAPAQVSKTVLSD
jgi:hypothetical protein